MASPHSLALTRVIVYSLDCSRLEHGRSIIRNSTRRGTLSHVIGRARGDWAEWLSSLARNLSSEEFLLGLGIRKPVSLLPPTEDELEDESIASAYAWSLHIVLLGLHLVNMLGYMYCFPMAQHSLLDKSDAGREWSLNHHRDIWRVWQAAEDFRNLIS